MAYKFIDESSTELRPDWNEFNIYIDLHQCTLCLLLDTWLILHKQLTGICVSHETLNLKQQKKIEKEYKGRENKNLLNLVKAF